MAGSGRGNRQNQKKNRIFKDASSNLVSIHFNIGARTTFSFNFTRFDRQIKVSLQLFPLHSIWLISFNINGVKRGCMSSILLGFVFPSATFYKSNQLKEKRQYYSSDLGEFHIYLAILEVISVADFSFSQTLAFWQQSQKGHIQKESFQVKVF